MRNVITALKEHKEFKKERPWDANILTYPADEFIPPHYAETIEVLLCCGVLGDIHIGGREFSLDGHKVFFIPPNVIHTINYKKNNGFVTVLKINTAELKPIFDINALLMYYNKDYSSLPYCLPEYNKIKAIGDIFMNSSELTEIIAAISDLVHILMSYADGNTDTLQKSDYNDDLHKIIGWTEENFSEKITLESVAALAGYDKHYFCTKFKKATGVTYLNYLNTLRIHHACNLLKSGVSVKEACDECGFENVSYFINLFKKTMGSTPKKYSRMS